MHKQSQQRKTSYHKINNYLIHFILKAQNSHSLFRPLSVPLRDQNNCSLSKVMASITAQALYQFNCVLLQNCQSNDWVYVKNNNNVGRERSWLWCYDNLLSGPRWHPHLYKVKSFYCCFRRYEVSVLCVVPQYQISRRYFVIVGWSWGCFHALSQKTHSGWHQCECLAERDSSSDVEMYFKWALAKSGRYKGAWG